MAQTASMALRHVRQTAIRLAPLGFGAFKIGRNVGAKYPERYELPSDEAVDRLLNGVLDLGVNLIDTAPAYGTSEERIGRAVAHRRSSYHISTKVGEHFRDGKSTFDFSRNAIESSINASMRRLQTDWLDIVLLHSDGNDLRIQDETDAVETLQSARDRGLIRAYGISCKTVEGARRALSWAHVIMVPFHAQDTSFADVMAQAHESGVTVLIKKGLASGTLPAEEAVRFVLRQPAVDTLVVGTRNLEHMRSNLTIAQSLRPA